jgi:hypothetical protein
MATTLSQAVERFLVLNDRFVRSGLDGEDYEQWNVLSRTFDAALRDAAPRQGAPRRHARAPLRLPVRLATPVGNVEGHTVDVAAGGCGIEVPRPIADGAELEVTLELPSRPGQVGFWAAVCWAAPADTKGWWRAGVTFASRCVTAREIISAHVLANQAPRLLAQETGAPAREQG